MKSYLHLISFLFLFFISCNNNSTTSSTITPPQDISESTLPKGKLIVDDEQNTKSNGANQTAANGYNADPNNTNTTTAPSPDDLLKRRFKNLLVFHADDTMKIKKAYIATLILGKDQVLGTIKEEALESANASDENIKHDTSVDIGSRMRARLIDMSGATNKGFDIELIGGEEAATQSITEKRKKAIWNWKLIPQTPGQQELKLAITVLEKDGESVTLPTKNIPVLIFAEKESFIESVGSFFKNDSTKWILSAILIPIFLAWITSKIKYRHDIKASDGYAKQTQPQEPAAPNTSGNTAPQSTNTTQPTNGSA
jgi:hypothetical protein